MNAIARLIRRPSRPATPMSDRPVEVPFQPEHILAEQALRGLRQRRKAAQERLEALTSAMPGASTPEMRQAMVEIRRLDLEIKQARDTVAPLRTRHLDRVRQATRDPMRSAARRVLEAVAEVETAVAELNALRAAVRQAGGEAPDISTKALLYVSVPVERLARATKDPS